MILVRYCFSKAYPHGGVIQLPRLDPRSPRRFLDQVARSRGTSKSGTAIGLPMKGLRPDRALGPACARGSHRVVNDPVLATVGRADETHVADTEHTGVNVFAEGGHI